MGGQQSKEASDKTAAGVAKIRHIETVISLRGDEQRLFEDPYAAQFYPGSSFVGWIPLRLLMGLVSDEDAGLSHLIAGRTYEFDEQVLTGIKGGIKQVVILGVGYDTRGFRLITRGFPVDGSVQVFEIDQPDVQKRKQATMNCFDNIPNKENVHFVTVDFNHETLDKVRDVQQYNPAAPTLFILEGVTQHIPKDATATTVKTAASLCGPGSRFVVSYVPQELYDAPENCGCTSDMIKGMLDRMKGIGEPWISAWHTKEFSEFMQRNEGWEVQRDVSIQEMVDEYYTPANREVPESHRIMFERYATAFRS